MLDNECPGGLEQFLRNSSVKFQLVPPHLRCTNTAKRAIQTYKDHLIAGLSICDPNFALHLWDLLIPHATLTLNLLRPSRLNPRLSAEAQLNGAFNYNRTPLAPPVTRVVVHEAPGNRHTWDPNGVNGWYLGPARNHYLMIPLLHSADPFRTYRKNCTVIPSRLPHPIHQLHKRRHRGRLCTRQGSLTSHFNPVCNSERR